MPPRTAPRSENRRRLKGRAPSTSRPTATSGSPCAKATPCTASTWPAARSTTSPAPASPGFTGNGGPARLATIAGPKGIAISPDGRRVYLADTETHTVRAIDLTQTPPTLERHRRRRHPRRRPGLARTRGAAGWRACTASAIDPETGDLYIGDSENHKVRVIRGLGGTK